MSKEYIWNQNFSIKDRTYSSSFLSDFLGCPRLAYYKWVRRLVPKVEKPALRFGSAFHAALKEWYKGEGDVKFSSARIEKCLEEFADLDGMVGDDHRTRGWGESIFKEYVSKYPKENWETLHLEISGRVEIGERLYGFTIDQIVKWNNQIYVVDHKTTSSLGLSFFNGYRPHPQTDGYCFACKETCGQCSGAIMNGISVAQNPKVRFQRFPSPRTNQELVNFVEMFEEATSRFEHYIQVGKFPMNSTFCNRWGKCQFMDCCVYGEDERMLENEFMVREL